MFDRYSGFVRHFCRERSIRATRRPVARAFLAPGLRKAEPDSRTFRSPPDCILVLSPGGAVRLRMDTAPGGTSSLSLSFLSRFSARCRNCSPPGLSVRPDRKPSAADRKVVAFGCRIGPECRFLSGRSGSRPAPEPPPRRSPAEASYSVRTDTAIIYLIMRRAYPPRGCDISQPRLEAHRPCLRPFPATRSLPTEGSSRAKAGTSGHMIRDGDGLHAVPEISVRFPFSARRGRPLRAA